LKVLLAYALLLIFKVPVVNILIEFYYLGYSQLLPKNRRNKFRNSAYIS
jgi:hypothetical protein